MGKYIIIVSIGPVQSFIAAARKSQDLWCGSWLLSEVAKAVAKALHQNGAELIFPHIAQENLDKQLKFNSPLTTTNRIQAIVNTTPEKLENLTQNITEAAQERLNIEAEKVKEKLAEINLSLEVIWNKQLTDYLDIHIAWAKIDDDKENAYQLALKQVNTVMGARKATRNFLPSPAQSALDKDYMVFKSSLDGARETVLPNSTKMTLPQRRYLRLGKSEYLDCVGVIKRLGGNTEQFTSFSRVTAAGWINQLNGDERNSLNTIYEKLINSPYDKEGELGIATRTQGNQKCYENLPYDGEFVYLSRVQAMRLEIDRELTSIQLEADKKQLEADKNNLKELEGQLPKIYTRIGKPCTYGVMLMADGDYMGKLIDAAKTKEDHQLISKQLSSFASSVADIIRGYDGQCIYAGGDDVMGLLPLHNAYDCAEALHNQFQTSLKNVAKQLGVETTPTLSVGLAIVHFLTPFGHVRELAKQAESLAKGNLQSVPHEEKRNALGVIFTRRSGATEYLRLRWDDEAGHGAFQQWQKAFSENKTTNESKQQNSAQQENGKLPTRIAYDIQDIYKRTNFPKLRNSSNTTDNLSINEMRHAELKRLCKQKRTSSGQEIDGKWLTAFKQRLEKINNNFEQLASELIIARWLSAKTQQDREG